MTFSELELHWLEYCVLYVHDKYSGVVDLTQLLRRIDDEKTELKQKRVPRTISETREYKDKDYAKNKPYISARMAINYAKNHNQPIPQDKVKFVEQWKAQREKEKKEKKEQS